MIKNTMKYFVLLSALYFLQTEQQVFKYEDGYRSSCQFHADGNFNLIISAPHGGTIAPIDVPDRRNGCSRFGGPCTWAFNDSCHDGKICTVTTRPDHMSGDFAQNVANQLYQQYNLKPYLVIGKWQRKKIDFNREISEAAQNDPEAIKAHASYHAILQNFVDKVNQTYKTGLLLDFHGHGFGDYIMVGYFLGLDELNKDDLETTSATKISIERLCTNGRNECIRGHNSFGTILEAHDLGIAYPSLMHPKPGNIKFFEGGYNMRKHISKINAVQTELPYDMRTGVNREKYAVQYTAALYKYMKVNGILN